MSGHSAFSPHATLGLACWHSQASSRAPCGEGTPIHTTRDLPPLVVDGAAAVEPLGSLHAPPRPGFRPLLVPTICRRRPHTPQREDHSSSDHRPSGAGGSPPGRKISRNLSDRMQGNRSSYTAIQGNRGCCG